MALPAAPRPRNKMITCLFLGLGGIVISIGSCGVWFGYSIYRAGTPQGKKEAAADTARQNAELTDFLAKLGRIRTALPAADAKEVACPAGTHAPRAPVVDTLYLGAILDGT